MSIANKRKLGLVAVLAVILMSLCAVLLFAPSADETNMENTYYTVTVRANNESYGSVRVDLKAGQPEDKKNDAGQFLYGTEITLTAKPATGYRLAYWENVQNGDIYTNPSQDPTSESSITPLDPVQTDITYRAVFEPIKYSIHYLYGIIVNDKGEPIHLDENGTPKNELDIAKKADWVSEHTYGSSTKLPLGESKPSYECVGWRILGEESNAKKTLTELGPQEYQDDISLVAIYRPRVYNVTCYDRIAGSDTVLGEAVISSYYGATVTGKEAIEKKYPGYYFPGTEDSYTSVKVTINEPQNIVYRNYRAKTYRIIYRGCDKAEELHTYGRDSVIRTPEREGYEFTGWKIVNYNEANYKIPQDWEFDNNSFVIAGDAYDTDAWTEENRGSEEVAIILEAQWKVREYQVSYEGIDNVTAQLPDKRVYDQDFTLPAELTREGYTFLGWKLKGSAGAFSKEFTISKNSNPSDVTIVAGWEANKYQVTLNPGESADQKGDTSAEAVFDSALPKINIPVRKGYIFVGYYTEPEGRGVKYYDGEGNGVLAWNIAKDTELYAYWQVSQYTVTVDSDLLEHATVTLNGILYEGTPIPFDFNTAIKVVITAQDGWKLINWNGTQIAHTKTYEADPFILTEDTTLTGAVGQTLSTPSFVVDYRNEIFTVSGGIPAGSYVLSCGNTVVEFTVDANGLITFANSSPSNRLRADAYFGSEVSFVLRGNGTTTADSDPLTVTVAARPGAPKLNEEIHHIAELDNSIEIVMNSKPPFTFEFACSTSLVENGSGLTWGSKQLFENLNPGTPYYIYIRVAASDSYPHGELYITTVTTLRANYLANQIDLLMGLRQPGDGENVDRLLQDAKEKMENCPTGPNYVSDLKAIYQNAANGMDLARAKDRAVAELRSIHADLKASNAYSDVGIMELDRILKDAVEAIGNATTISDVNSLAETAKTNFYAVLITNLFYGNEFWLTCMGMNRDYKLIASRITDIGTVTSQIQRAVQAGTIVVGGTQMTLAEATRALQSLDVVGYYQLRLSYKNGAGSAAKPMGPFTVRILLPEDLRDETGLQVAYYKNDTGELTVLDTQRNGNYLIFTADSVEDFVILADRAVELGGLLIALAATLFFQLIAIVLLLVRRRKSAKAHKSYALALPLVALTVRFFPENSMTLAIVLGVLVAICQVILLWLLITSDLIFRKKKKQPEPDYTAKPAANPQPEEPAAPASSSPSEPYLTVLATNSAPEEEYEELDEGYPADDGAEEPDLSDAPVYEPDPEPEAQEPEDWYGENDFIEPAATTRYSLPEDEDTLQSPYEEDPEQSEGSDEAYSDEYTEEYTDESYDDTESYTDTESYADETYWGTPSSGEADLNEAYPDEEYAAEEPAEDSAEDTEYDPMSVFEADPEDGNDTLQY